MPRTVLRLAALAAAFAVAFAAAAGARASADAAATLALGRDPAGLFTVALRVNGAGPFPFVVDTGAGATVFDETLVAELGLVALDLDVTVHGVSSHTLMPAYTGAEIALGDEIARPQWVLAHDLELGAARGVLGADVLAAYAVDLDWPQREMRLHTDRFNPPRRRPLARTRISIDRHGLPYIVARVNRRRMTLLVDTGFDGMLLRRDAASRARLRYRSADGELVDIADDQERLRRVSRTKVTLGAATWENAFVIINDAPVFARLGGDTRADGILGVTLLAGTRFVVDYPNRRLWLIESSRD